MPQFFVFFKNIQKIKINSINLQIVKIFDAETFFCVLMECKIILIVGFVI